MDVGARSRASPFIWPVIGLPALPYAVFTSVLWKFPGCPPESLEYPGHPAPSVPLAASVVLLIVLWSWFCVWALASVGVHLLLRKRPSLLARVSAFAVPSVITLTTPLGAMFALAIATLC